MDIPTTIPIIKNANDDNNPRIKRLRPTGIKSIQLSSILIPDIYTGGKPPDYWNIFNNGVGLYEKGLFVQAKDEFKKLLSYEKPHITLYTYLLRSYRKIIDGQIKADNYLIVLQIFDELFIECKDDVTNTDRKKYNSIAEKINKNNLNETRKLLIFKKKEDTRDFIIITDKAFLKYVSKRKTEINNIFRRDWDNVYSIGEARIFIRSSYANTIMLVKDQFGKVLTEKIFDKYFYRFKASENSDRFVVMTYDLQLSTYSINGECLNCIDLKPYSDNRYYVRCVDISANAKYVMFVASDKAYLLNKDLEILSIYCMPEQDGWNRITKNKSEDENYTQYLSILGLTGKPSLDEIKKTFKQLVLKNHPDVNPLPNATEKTRDLIMAYEYLSGEEVQKALSADDDGEYFEKIIKSVKMSGFVFTESIVSNSGDTIYSTHICKDTNSILFGTYSGKVYEVTVNGLVIKQYKCDRTVRLVRKKGDFYI